MNNYCGCYGGWERRNIRGWRIFGAVIGGLTITVLLAIGLGWLVELLWNHTLTLLFKVPMITYWQAVGVLILGRLLFGGVGHGHFHGRKHAWHHHHHLRTLKDMGLKRESRFREFWEAEGREAFERYMEKNEK